jgi:hypothetical protein
VCYPKKQNNKLWVIQQLLKITKTVKVVQTDILSKFWFYGIKGTVQRKLIWVKSVINRQLITCHCSDGYFFLIKGPSLFKKRKCVFSIKRHFVVEWSVNVESTANVCSSGALQAAVTGIAACIVPLLLS